jgi:hypothetical protein
MRKHSPEYNKILNKLTYAEPNEVGKILKEYFKLKKNLKK